MSDLPTYTKKDLDQIEKKMKLHEAVNEIHNLMVSLSNDCPEYLYYSSLFCYHLGSLAGDPKTIDLWKEKKDD